jgi:hypothetical protein
LGKIEGSKRSLTVAPTGSGKSTVAKARGAIELARNRKLKHLVSVPQNVIADGSFRSLENVSVSWQGLGRLGWCPGRELVGACKVRQLVQFITDPAKNTPEGRTLVCTHQALVSAYKKLQEGGKLAALKNVFLTIDEVHHSSAPDEQEDLTIDNQLGRVVKHYFKNDLRLDMFTATWGRGDCLGIIPSQYRAGKDYTKYVLPVDKYLEGMNYLQEIAIRFLIGTPEDCIRHLFREGHNKTIVYLPPVNSPITSWYENKYLMREALSRSLGPSRSANDGMTEAIRMGENTIRTLDLVTEEGRGQRKDWFLEQIRERSSASPDLLWALNLCKEGFDWPEAERSLVIGPRGSMLDVVQMLGRLLRDVPGKERVEFNVVLPTSGTREEDPNSIRSYLQIMLSTLVVEWQFRRPKLRNAKEEAIADKVFVQEPVLAQKAVAACLNAGVNSDDGDDAVEATRKELEKLDLGLDQEEVNLLAPILVRLVAQNAPGSKHVRFEPRLVRDVFERVRSWTARFGYKTLTELREALGRAECLTEEKILEWCDSFHAEHGDWPTHQDIRPVPGHPGESWNALSQALRQGLRGLPKGSSLPRLLEQKRGRRNHLNLPILTKDQILEWCDYFQKKYGRWPTQSSREPIPDRIETWKSIESCLKQGLRGLPGESSLSQLLEQSRGRRNIQNLPRLTEDQILEWCDAFYSEHGEWPDKDRGAVEGHPGETWSGINSDLRAGARGLTGGLSLPRLLELRGRKNKHHQPGLTEDQILERCDAFYSEHGEWPLQQDLRPVPGHPNETWLGLSKALSSGRRGLPGGTSLSQLLAKERGRRHRLSQPKLTKKKILEWCDAFHKLHGEYPSNRDERPVPNQPDETWSAVSCSLLRGCRGLSRGTTLTKLLEKSRGKRNRLNLPVLREPDVLKWYTIFHTEQGDWPTARDPRPVPGRPDESWAKINSALREGNRGLPGGSSLYQLRGNSILG